MNAMKKIARTTLFCLCVVSTSACAPVVAKRGNMLETFQLEQIKPGTSTKSDVLRIIGSPTTQSTFNTDVWYYIGQVTEKRGILDQEIAQERIFSLTFDKDGVLQAVEELTGNREDIPYARAKTPTHGNDFTFMQQLLGNLGRFNGAGSGGSSPTDLGR